MAIYFAAMVIGEGWCWFMIVAGDMVRWHDGTRETGIPLLYTAGEAPMYNDVMKTKAEARVCIGLPVPSPSIQLEILRGGSARCPEYDIQYVINIRVKQAKICTCCSG